MDEDRAPPRLLLGMLAASMFWLPLTLFVSSRPSEVASWAAPAAGDSALATAENDRPVIALLASDCGILYNCSSYIPASYVRWVQQGGALVVPLHPKMEARASAVLLALWHLRNPFEAEFDHVLSHSNGVLTIGGFFKMNGTADQWMARVFAHAMRAARRGEVFPVWATCVGIHDLAQLATGRVYAEFLSRTYADNVALPLLFEGDLARFFDEQRWPGSSTFQRWLQASAITFQHHEWGILRSTFSQIKELSESFEVLASSVDQRGQRFVSLMQHRQAPLFASAFHPEKPAFEWGVHRHGLLRNTAIPHSRQAVLANLHFGAVFVQQARRNFRRFEKADLSNRLIFNSPIFYTARLPQLIRYFEEAFG
ncbi:unnamed protein product [Effrenium voratum]|uniref:folate gamma-glutamyl hydrolase n=2 Tax=Effrenium voratum TaxID=2562239 RepID=A0AA36N9V3_9DINO|nr:unnamed protein product [Effrenium voratum]